VTRLLITGGAGFIGANLAGHARAAGVDVTVLDDLSASHSGSLDGLEVNLVVGSVLDAGMLDIALRGVDSVVHLAAVADVPSSIRAPLASHAANATGTLMVLEACRRNGVGHLVAASSSAVYGANSASPAHERQWVRPLSPYGVICHAEFG
jgi:UDP-glucose 4-epimerase